MENINIVKITNGSRAGKVICGYAARDVETTVPATEQEVKAYWQEMGKGDGNEVWNMFANPWLRKINDAQE